jgi:hypothetical protein
MGKIENKNAAERFDQMHSATVERMFWIGCSLTSDGFAELSRSLMEGDFAEMFLDVDIKKLNEYRDDENTVQFFIDRNKLGFIAEISVPQCHEFQYQPGKGRPIKWSVDNSVSRVVYCYGETPDELINKIEKSVEKCFSSDIELDKKKRGKQDKQNFEKIKR